MKLLLLNQYGPDSGAPTGRILAELGSALERQGHQVRLLTTDTSYGKPSRGRERILREGLSHLRLIWSGLHGPKVDAVISLTSPACLAVTAGVVARLRRARHFHWAMDLYPDVGVRLGELPEGRPIKLLSSLMRYAYQHATQVITLDEDMRDYVQNTYGVSSTVLEPFPPDITWPKEEPQPGPMKRWLYSGNFGRAHEIRVLLKVQEQLEARNVPVELIMQGQGPQLNACRNLSRDLGLRRVQWRAAVPLDKLGESLREADVLVVTRKPDMKGLLLPSKLMLAEHSGRPILWIGDTDGKTAQRLASENRHGVFKPEAIEPIAAWLENVLKAPSSATSVAPRPTAPLREEALRQWEKILQQNT